MEMWPRGAREHSRLLGEAFIINTGGTATHGKYRAYLSKFKGIKNPHAPESVEVWKRTRLEGFPRKRLGPWDLLFRVLDLCVGTRTKGDPNHG